MNQSEITSLFDKHAASYDAQWEKTAAIRNGLYYVLESLFVDLPADAKILAVGVGTGLELTPLALKHPGWTFTAVEPSRSMLDECRKRAEREGFADRCTFHQGYLDTLPGDSSNPVHDAATCFLVSQFILDRSDRIRFFKTIAAHLKPGGVLASSDLAADITTPEYDLVLRAWANMMSSAGITPEAVARMRNAYATDVAVIPPAQIESIITEAGFKNPVLFYQAGLIHAWLSTRV